jgi:branched-chain amino acid transport system substrate-binding protein
MKRDDEQNSTGSAGIKRIMGLVLFALLCFAFPISGFAADDKVPGVTDDEVVIGMSCPMSGPAALWAAMYLGNSAWAQHINAQGGIHGRKIRWVVKDDGYNPSRALANFMEMKDSVFAYGTVMGSATANATKDFFIESGVPVVHVHANPRIWMDVPRSQMNHIFIAYADYVDEADTITRVAVNQIGVKKIALFGQNDDWGKGAKDGIDRAMKSLGGKASFVGYVPYELTDRAMAAHAQRLRDTAADAVLIFAAPTQASLVIREMAKIGYRPKIFTCTPLGDPLMYRITGELWEGAYPAASGNLDMPGVDARADEILSILVKYEPKLAGTPYLGITGSTTMMLIEEALRRAGRHLTRESFIEAMASLEDFKAGGMGAPISFGENRHGLNAIRLFQAKDGKHIPISDYFVFDPLF